jgi:hypothetical protein
MACPTHSTTASRRAILGAALAAPALLATIGAAHAATSAPRSDFDAALRAYYRARDADQHDASRGALKAAYDLYHRRTKPLIEKYGSDHMHKVKDAADAVQWNAYFEDMKAAEGEYAIAFSEPRWTAAAALYATSAPNLAALMIKIETATEEGDSDDILQFVRSDLAHLSAQEA